MLTIGINATAVDVWKRQIRDTRQADALARERVVGRIGREGDIEPGSFGVDAKRRAVFLDHALHALFEAIHRGEHLREGRVGVVVLQ